MFWNTYQGTIAAPNLYMIRVNLDWTDMNAPVMPVPARLKVAFGDKKGERIWQDNINVVESMETNVSRFRLDLSHPPQS